MQNRLEFGPAACLRIVTDIVLFVGPACTRGFSRVKVGPRGLGLNAG